MKRLRLRLSRLGGENVMFVVGESYHLTYDDVKACLDEVF